MHISCIYTGTLTNTVTRAAMHTYAHAGGAIRGLTGQPADLHACLFELRARIRGSWQSIATERAQIALDCCCRHALRRRFGQRSNRPANAAAAGCCCMSPAAMALPGGRGRASATYLTARTLRTRAGAGQMAMCVSRHVTANENQFFEPVASGVMQG